MSLYSLRLTVILCVISGLSGCSFQRETWTSTLAASPDAVEAALTSNKNYPYLLDVDRRFVPKIAPPTNLRPCCAFGMDIQSSLVNVSIPFYRVSNIIELADIGPHVYDAGFLGRGTDQEVKSNENNGLLYTCEGGFIDTAHIRDYSDWTVFLYTWIATYQGEDAELVLPPEIGSRTLKLHRYDNSQLSFVEQKQLNIALAQWLAFKLSVWHEIAQWHGLTTVEGFPEYASSYSVEDLYSNVLGAQIGGALIAGHATFTDQLYARSFDNWLNNTLVHLKSLPIEQSRAYMQAVDQHWWDSNERLPEKYIVLARNYDVGLRQQPPRIPKHIKAGLSEELQQACPDEVPAREMVLEARYAGFELANLASLQIDILPKYQEEFNYPNEATRTARQLTDADFSSIAGMSQLADEPELSKHLNRILITKQ